MNTLDKKQRIKQELVAAGVTNYGLIKGESRHLHNIIHDNEHIGGVIYGRYKTGTVMFIATSRRLLFLDHKVLFQRNDELTYDVLSGISFNPQGRFAGVVVHTRLGDFSLRFVNRHCAEVFVKFVEKRRIEKNGNNTNAQTKTVTPSFTAQQSSITKETRIFLLSHNLATISTVGADGKVSGAVIYYALSPDNIFHIVTKANTKKAQDITHNKQIALTIYDENARKTAQIQGDAEIVKNESQADHLLHSIVKPHIYNAHVAWPPITKIAAGAYEVIRIVPTSVKYNDYS